MNLHEARKLLTWNQTELKLEPLDYAELVLDMHSRGQTLMQDGLPGFISAAGRVQVTLVPVGHPEAAGRLYSR